VKNDEGRPHGGPAHNQFTRAYSSATGGRCPPRLVMWFELECRRNWGYEHAESQEDRRRLHLWLARFGHVRALIRWLEEQERRLAKFDDDMRRAA
jgi:hypothetical protein